MSSDMSHRFPALWLLMGVGERYRLVETVDEAAHVLVHNWPLDDGSRYLGALSACRDALLGVVPANAAREALMRAADEALISYICVVQGGGGFNLSKSGCPGHRPRLKYRARFGFGTW